MPYAPLTVYSEQVALAGDGWVMACYYPQNFPAGESGLSSIDMMRAALNVSRPNIVHTTIGGLVRGLTPEEQMMVLGILDDFNQEPLVEVMFSTVKLFHEKKFFLFEKEFLAAIQLTGNNDI
jgi:hypothetical protein